MSNLSIDLHSSKSTIRLSFHFQNVTNESLYDIYCSKFSNGCNTHVLGWRPQPCVSSLQLDVGCPVVIAAAIPDTMLVPTDECFTQEVPEHAYDGLACPNMLYGIQIRAHGWPRNTSHGFALEVGDYCSWTMMPGVVIHIHKPCSEWVVVEMGDNNWLQDVSDVLITN
jgi:hypothetical protein